MPNIRHLSGTARATAHTWAALCAALISILCLSACGGSGSDVVVARVGDKTITKAALERWTAIEAVLSYQTDPTKPVPKGVVPDPPDYANCIAYLASAGSKPAGSQQKSTAVKLMDQCRQRYRLLQHHILDILITNSWLDGEGAAQGLAVSDAEVKQALDQQFPTPAALQRFLKITGEKASDERALLKSALMATKLQRAAAAKRGLSAAQQQQAVTRFTEAFTERWSARTSCQPGYVVQECRQYKGPKSAAGV
jgi:hypothetical protein